MEPRVSHEGNLAVKRRRLRAESRRRLQVESLFPLRCPPPVSVQRHYANIYSGGAPWCHVYNLFIKPYVRGGSGGGGGGSDICNLFSSVGGGSHRSSAGKIGRHWG